MRHLICFLFLFPLLLPAQNLIINPGFEEHSSNTGESGTDAFKMNGVTGWFNPNKSSSDYNSSGGDHAHSGNCGAGFYAIDLPYYEGAEYREYVGGSLSKPLVAGKEYRFSMAITVKGWLNCAVKELGVYFCNSKYMSDGYFEIDETPQIVLKGTNVKALAEDWIIVKGKFIAKGGERYFVVGNFKDNDHTDLIGIGEQHSAIDAAYYYIDDLCLLDNNDPTPDITTNGEQHTQEVVVNEEPEHSDVEEADHSSEKNKHVTKNIEEEDHSGKSKNNSVVVEEDPQVIVDKDPEIIVEEHVDPPTPKLDSIVINAGERFVAENIYFNTDKSTLKEESFAPLDQIVAAMKAKPQLNVEVDGYTDDSGSLTYNKKLSEARAKTVAKYLIKHGIKKSRVTYKGCGAYIKRGSKPKAGDQSSGRRVEFVFSNQK